MVSTPYIYPEDRERVNFPYEDAFIISKVLANHRVHLILMDDHNAINILLSEVMPQLRINPLKLILVNTHLIRVAGTNMLVKSVLKIPITFRSFPKYITLQQSLMVIDTSLTYNAIIGRPLLHQINIAISTRYLTLKFCTQ
jgi:hypothetical protein